MSSSFCGLELECRVCGGLSMGMKVVEAERFDLRLTWVQATHLNRGK